VTTSTSSDLTAHSHRPFIPSLFFHPFTPPLPFLEDELHIASDLGKTQNEYFHVLLAAIQNTESESLDVRAATPLALGHLPMVAFITQDQKPSRRIPAAHPR
jgi:hypothetical protein